MSTFPRRSTGPFIPTGAADRARPLECEDFVSYLTIVLVILMTASARFIWNRFAAVIVAAGVPLALPGVCS
jgi:hypothetical protein